MKTSNSSQKVSAYAHDTSPLSGGMFSFESSSS